MPGYVGVFGDVLEAMVSAMMRLLAPQTPSQQRLHSYPQRFKEKPKQVQAILNIANVIAYRVSAGFNFPHNRRRLQALSTTLLQGCSNPFHSKNPKLFVSGN